MIEENRKKVALQSELLAKGEKLDGVYKKHLQALTNKRNVNLNEEMTNFQLEQETVKL